MIAKLYSEDLPLMNWICLRKHENIFEFSIISRYRNVFMPQRLPPLPCIEPSSLKIFQLQYQQEYMPFYSLAPGKFGWNFRYLILQIISVIDGWGISCILTLRWMSFNLNDDKSTLVQVMAWCRQATSHYLSQCWPRSLSPHGVTRPQWVKQ